MKTDVQIAQETKKKKIIEIANYLGFPEEALELYGNYKAKINISELKDYKNRQEGKLILVTAITPTPLGEGKTTTVIGLGDGLNKIGKKTVLSLREPSLGPVFGIKGGATGGGYAQVVPMEDINLHFTGDFNAIGAANNLLAAMLDNHIYHGNELDIDPSTITLKRVVDMNDRQLRFIVDGLNGKTNGFPREDGFEIVAASEIMAILCLSKNLMDLKEKLSKVIVAYNKKGEPVTAKDLNAQGPMTVLLKDAIKPNLVQTLEHTPCIIHGGPFANIAHGCNSIIATKLALKYADYVVTEAGFGADLGAEKFFNIKCRFANLNPNAVVLVATVKALKMHGGKSKNELEKEDINALKKGFSNLKKHIENIKTLFGIPCIVAINKYPFDTKNEIKLIEEKCKKLDVKVIVSDAWAKGSQGTIELAKEVVELAKNNKPIKQIYDIEDSLEEKLNKIVTKVYGGKGITLSEKIKRKIQAIEKLGFKNIPICMAKTQYSFSDNNKLLDDTDFKIEIKDIKVAAGAGFVVAYSGNIMTMPGLSKNPAANNIDIKEDGKIVGLF